MELSPKHLLMPQKTGPICKVIVESITSLNKSKTRGQICPEHCPASTQSAVKKINLTLFIQISYDSEKGDYP